MWSIEKKDGKKSEMEWFEKCQDLGYYSLIFLTQAIGNQNVNEDIELLVLTNNMRDLFGEKIFYPDKATILGPVNVISKEYSNIRCRSIDINLPEPGSWQWQNLIHNGNEPSVTCGIISK